MERKKLLKHLIFLMFFIFILNYLDSIFYWGSLFWYFDIITHTLGGLWVGLFFFYFYLRAFPDITTKRLFWYSLVSTIVIGLFWEIYEAYLDSIVSYTYFTGDSLADMFFDTFGFMLAFGYYVKAIMPQGGNKVKS